MPRQQATGGQIVGGLILAVTAIFPGLALAGFHGGTAWSLLGWLFVAIPGGFVGGLLMVPTHRFAGAIGGMIGSPLGMVALYLYALGRMNIYKVEAVIIWCLGALPGIGTFFVLKFLTNALFPATAKTAGQSRRHLDDDDDDEEDDEDEDENDEQR